MEVGQKRLVEAFLCQLVFLAEAPGEHELIARLAQGTGRTDLAVKAGKGSSKAGISVTQNSYPIIDLEG